MCLYKGREEDGRGEPGKDNVGDVDKNYINMKDKLSETS